MIEVSELTKRYPGRTAVNGISFTVARGEIVVFLGPNRAVKSTTMRLLSSFLPLCAIPLASHPRPTFAALLSLACASILFCHAIINIAMTAGVLPVVRVTLPLFSYGGSSVLTMLTCSALIINVSMRRFSSVADRL